VKLFLHLALQLEHLGMEHQIYGFMGCDYNVETLFGALKSRGFNLEDTRLQDPARLDKLLALLALAFTWAFVVGEWQATLKELKLKKHGYPPKSLFRLGLNILCRLVTNFEYFDVTVWNRVIKLLSCTWRKVIGFDLLI
jgi:hypothetical protein